MIIYGSRMLGIRNIVHAHGVCEHCGRWVRHKSYDGRKWGHIYFIPLFPCSGHVRVLRECPTCKMGAHLPLDKAAGLYHEMEALIQPCVEAAGQGQHTFPTTAGPEPNPTGPFLSTAIEMLHVTGHGEDIPGILDLLANDGATYEHAVAASAYEDLQGHADRALALMREAAAALPDNPYPQIMLAGFAARAGNAEAQLDHLRRANESAGGQDVGIMLEMAGPLEALGRYDELTALLEECIRLVPALGEDKKLVKLQKKFAKKAAKAKA